MLGLKSNHVSKRGPMSLNHFPHYWPGDPPIMWAFGASLVVNWLHCCTNRPETQWCSYYCNGWTWDCTRNWQSDISWPVWIYGIWNIWYLKIVLLWKITCMLWYVQFQISLFWLIPNNSRDKTFANSHLQPYQTRMIRNSNDWLLWIHRVIFGCSLPERTIRRPWGHVSIFGNKITISPEPVFQALSWKLSHSRSS